MSGDNPDAGQSDPDDVTQIRVTKAQREELHDMLGPGDRYRDAVAQLLEKYHEDAEVRASTS